MNVVQASLFGIKIIISQDRPGYRLPDDCPCTPAYRAEFNAWAKTFFSPKNSLRDGEIMMIDPSFLSGGLPGEVYTMNPRTYAQFQEALKQYNQGKDSL